MVTAVPLFPCSRECRPRGPPCSTWLHACEWEDEEEASTGAVSSMGGFYQSGSECEVEESLKVRAWAQESATGHQCSGESSEGPASTFDSDVPHVVPCKFIISLAFPVTAGKCEIGRASCRERVSSPV